MKLSDLNPKFLGTDNREGVGVDFDCPCGCATRCFVPFANPLDGGPSIEPRGWERTGSTFDALTLKPSILRKRPDCWHGFITDGEIIFCSDSKKA